MPRRPSTRFQPQPQPTSSPPPQPADGPSGDDPLRQLRTQWKWAAFSQFFFTFNHLFNMSDVSLNDIEGDLVRGSCIVLPRIMQRLLYTLSYDRKVSLDNWQTALRKQYRKRDAAANPIGPEPRLPTPEAQADEGQFREPPVPDVEETKEVEDTYGAGPSSEPAHKLESNLTTESTRASTLERGVSESVSDSKAMSVQASGMDTCAGTVDGTDREDTQPQSEDQDESKNWLDLSMLAKLDSMHVLTEWQFQHPTRLRTLMRNDDDGATWRIEPIGYDSKKNAYWLIGADRLWLQRPIPKPPRPKPGSGSLKRKRGANPGKYSAKLTAKSHTQSKSSKQTRLSPEPQLSLAAPGGRQSRAAKKKANVKLDQQAKELAALNRQAATLAKHAAGLRSSERGLLATDSQAGTRSSKRGGGSSPPKAVGTRLSRRLRGNLQEDDEWQAVPEEWLNEDDEKAVSRSRRHAKQNGKGKRREDYHIDEENGEDEDGEDDGKAKKKLKTGLESDESDISDLTELSELSEVRSTAGEDTNSGAEESTQILENSEVKDELKSITTPVHAVDPVVDDRGLEPPPILPDGFIEWETICVTLYEWEHIAERFANATHYSEKALYKVLKNSIVPIITEELREFERKQQLSVALTQRKRSSRLLLRQSEKEEAEAAARKIAEEQEKNSRAKRLAARLKKEEEERERRETSREMRRREREEKEQQARENKVQETSTKSTPNGSSDAYVDIEGTDPLLHHQQLTQPKHNGNGTGSGSGSRTPIGEDWELDCEICHKRGINLDDGTPMMSCGICSKWQHIDCHDRADQRSGHKRRNWDVVEFFCSHCLSRGAGARSLNGRGSQLAGQAPRTTQNPYMHTLGNVTPYNRNLYTNTIGQGNTLINGMIGGGSTSYVREPQVPHNIPHQRPEPHQSQMTQQPYVSTISFSHYQPQEHGFSSSLSNSSPYHISGHTQPYGQPTTINSNPYMRYPPTVTTNGGGAAHETSQARWNVTTPAQTSGYVSHSTYNMATTTPSISYRGSAGNSSQPPTQWQNQPLPQTQTTPSQNVPQPQHLPTSYQLPQAPP